MSIPIRQADCDPNDPDTHALWALRSLPAPIRLKVSRDLWEAGFRWQEDLQAVRYETDPSTALLGAHAPAQAFPIKRDDAKRILAEVNPEMAAQVADAEVKEAAGDPSTADQLRAKQRAGLKKLQEELGHTLGDR